MFGATNTTLNACHLQVKHGETQKREALSKHGDERSVEVRSVE